MSVQAYAIASAGVLGWRATSESNVSMVSCEGNRRLDALAMMVLELKMNTVLLLNLAVRLFSMAAC